MREQLLRIADELAATAADIVSAFGHSGRWAQTLEADARELLDLAEHLPAWDGEKKKGASDGSADVAPHERRAPSGARLPDGQPRR